MGLCMDTSTRTNNGKGTNAQTNGMQKTTKRAGPQQWAWCGPRKDQTAAPAA